MLGKNIRNRGLFFLLDIVVKVNKGKTGQPGELAPYRSFAAAHKAAQNQVSFVMLFSEALDCHLCIGAPQNPITGVL